MKILRVGRGLFHMEGQTERQADMKKLIIVFQNFARAPKTHKILTHIKKEAIP